MASIIRGSIHPARSVAGAFRTPPECGRLENTNCIGCVGGDCRDTPVGCIGQSGNNFRARDLFSNKLKHVPHQSPEISLLVLSLSIAVAISEITAQQKM